MALDDPAGQAIDRPAETEGDGLDAVLVDQRGGELLDLPADALGAVGGDNRRPLQGRQPAAIGRPHAKLQFRTADFNAEEHRQRS